MKLKLLTSIMILILVAGMSGCANMNRTQQGAAIGTVAGGLLGNLIGNNKEGTLIGAVAGGAMGAIIGNDVEKRLQKATQNTNIEVIRVNDQRVDLKVPSGILFSVDSAQVNRGVVSNLQEIATIAQETPQAELVITGSTDSTGSASYNQKLGMERANSVRYELIRAGVVPSKIEAMSIGQSRAVSEIGDYQNAARYRSVTISMVTPQGADSVRRQNQQLRHGQSRP